MNDIENPGAPTTRRTQVIMTDSEDEFAGTRDGMSDGNSLFGTDEEVGDDEIAGNRDEAGLGNSFIGSDEEVGEDEIAGNRDEAGCGNSFVGSDEEVGEDEIPSYSSVQIPTPLRTVYPGEWVNKDFQESGPEQAIALVDETARTLFDKPSILNQVEIEKLGRQAKIPPDYKLLAPTTNQRMHNPPPSFLTVHADALNHGLRLPISPLLLPIFEGLELSPCQVGPIGIGQIVAWSIVMQTHGIEPHFENFKWFFTLAQNSLTEGLYTVTSRPRMKILGPLTSNPGNDWKKKYFYVRRMIGRTGQPLRWGVPLIWRTGSRTFPPVVWSHMPEELVHFQYWSEEQHYDPYAILVEPVLWLGGVSSMRPKCVDPRDLGFWMEESADFLRKKAQRERRAAAAKDSSNEGTCSKAAKGCGKRSVFRHEDGINLASSKQLRNALDLGVELPPSVAARAGSKHVPEISKPTPLAGPVVHTSGGHTNSSGAPLTSKKVKPCGDNRVRKADASAEGGKLDKNSRPRLGADEVDITFEGGHSPMRFPLGGRDSRSISLFGNLSTKEYWEYMESLGVAGDLTGFLELSGEDVIYKMAECEAKALQLKICLAKKTLDLSNRLRSATKTVSDEQKKSRDAIDMVTLSQTDAKKALAESGSLAERLAKLLEECDNLRMDLFEARQGRDEASESYLRYHGYAESFSRMLRRTRCHLAAELPKVRKDAVHDFLVSHSFGKIVGGKSADQFNKGFELAIAQLRNGGMLKDEFNASVHVNSLANEFLMEDEDEDEDAPALSTLATPIAEEEFFELAANPPSDASNSANLVFALISMNDDELSRAGIDPES